MKSFSSQQVTTIITSIQYFTFCQNHISSVNDHFCHFRRLVQSFDGSVVLRPQQAEPCPHLVLHVLLADNDEGFGKYTNTQTDTYWFTNTNTHTGENMDLAHKDEEHEEAAKEIETVDHPEEHLQVGGVVTQPALHFCV